METEGTTPAESVEVAEPIKVFAIVTTRDGMATAEGMRTVLTNPGPNIKLMTGIAAHLWPVDYMRSEVMEQAMKHEQTWDYVWFVDDDVIPHPKAINLALYDKDIIAAPYFALQWDDPQTPRLRWTVTTYDDEGNPTEGEMGRDVKEVDAVGMGCTFIHRRVFEALPQPWFEYKWNAITKVRHGEDFDFCNKAKRAGFKVWVDPKKVCSHCKLIDLKVVADLVQIQLNRQAKSYEKRIEELEAKINGNSDNAG